MVVLEERVVHAVPPGSRVPTLGMPPGSGALKALAAGRQHAPQDNNLSTSTRITLPPVVHGHQGDRVLPSGTSTEARIPAGVKDGQKVRVRGKGRPGTGGDLMVTVRVSDDPHYSREGNNLVLRAPSPWMRQSTAVCWKCPYPAVKPSNCG